MTDSELLRAIYNDTQDLKRKVTSMELTLENEINHNICIVAEAHSELNRKLDEALKVENEKELLLIRVNQMENEIRKIKERLEEIA